MSRRDLAQVLAEEPVLADVEARHVGLLAGCAKIVRFEPGQRIVAAGEPAERFWILRHGSVDVELHAAGAGTVVIDRVGPQELLGVSWIAPPYRWHFDATATDPGSAFEFDATCLRDRFATDPPLAAALHAAVARVLMERLQAARLRLLDVYADRGPGDG